MIRPPSRRSLLLAALAAPLAATPPARGQVEPRDICYWRRTLGPTCRNGRLQERWCEYCHGTGGATPTRCEWRATAAC